MGEALVKGIANFVNGYMGEVLVKGIANFVKGIWVRL